MKTKIIGIMIFSLICTQGGFSDTLLAHNFQLPGEWTILHPGDAGFNESPIEGSGMTPFANFISRNEKYFGYAFNYEPGAMTGSGSPMMGDFEFYPEWAEFGWAHLAEGDYRAILENFGTDLRRQFFWEDPGWEESFGSFYATGYANFSNEKYGFCSISLEVDVAWYLTIILFCDAEFFDDNIMEMKEILAMDR